MDTKSIKIPNILRAQVAVVGESTVGKTSMCHQLATDGTDFPKNYIMTTFSDIQVKSVKIPDTNDVVELFLVDSSGKEYYQDLLKESWSQANMIVAVYDCTREESFGNVTKWVDMVAQCQKSNDKGENNNAKLSGVLIANKIDLEDRRIISPKLGSDLANQLGLMYFECSAKEFKDVENPFYFIANEWHKMYTDSADNISDSTMGRRPSIKVGPTGPRSTIKQYLSRESSRTHL